MDQRLSRLGRLLAWFSLAVAALHFVWETYFHLKWGQFLPMLIVDYIAIALLVFGALGLLRLRWGPGLLCGAWGFEFCLNYRTFFIRVSRIIDGTADAAMTNIAYALGALLSISAVVFLLSAYLCVAEFRRRGLDA